MKNLFLFIALFAFLFFFTFAGSQKPENLNGNILEMTVEGMVCGHCAQGIKEALKKESCISNLFISVEHDLVAIELDPSQKIKEETIQKILKKKNFSASKIVRKNLDFKDWKFHFLKDHK